MSLWWKPTTGPRWASPMPRLWSWGPFSMFRRMSLSGSRAWKPRLPPRTCCSVTQTKRGTMVVTRRSMSAALSPALSRRESAR
ncbi:hypothetical protein D3C85_1692460 [compost metagenome]